MTLRMMRQALAGLEEGKSSVGEARAYLSALWEEVRHWRHGFRVCSTAWPEGG